MRLTSRSEYALLALVYLSRRKADGPVSVKTIAQDRGIPPRFLEQILLTLKRAKFVKSESGQRGGYALALPPGKITLAEVIRLIDGPLAPTASASKYFYGPTPIEKEKRLIALFKEIRNYVAGKLEKATLADMC